MIKPNFLVIGTARAGTTSLHYFLDQHPQICMSSTKEPNFFALDSGQLDFFYPGNIKATEKLIECSATNLQTYEHLFQSTKEELAVGEVSPFYLYSSGASKRIKQYSSEMKLIAILRDPVDRAYSHFTQTVSSSDTGFIDLDQKLKEEEINNCPGWAKFCIDLGLYSNQLEKYLELFDSSKIKIYLYKDFKIKPELVIQDIFRFIGVDETFIPDVSTKYNVAGVAKNKYLDLLFSRYNPLKLVAKKTLPKSTANKLAMLQNKIRNRNLVKPLPLTKAIRQKLIQNYYYEDILSLQTQIQRDLSSWLQ